MRKSQQPPKGAPMRPPAELPEGFDDPANPWYIPPAARPYYSPPTVDDWQRINRVWILPAIQPAEPGQTFEEHEAARQARLDTSEMPEYKAHSLALERAEAAAAREASKQESRRRWETDHECQICGEVAPGVAHRLVVNVPLVRGTGSAIRRTARACEPCTLAAVAAIVEHAAAELVDGHTRRDLAAVWLDQNG